MSERRRTRLGRGSVRGIKIVAAHLRTPPKPAVVALGFCLVIAIAVLDWATGPEVPFTIVYLLPVATVTWLAGKPGGYAMAAASAAGRCATDCCSPTFETAPVAVFWNAVLALAAFLIIVQVLSAVKLAGEELERKVEERTSALTAEIAERKRAEMALHRLAAQLSAAEDAERHRLATDMHDSVGQTLSVLKLNIETLAYQLNGTARQHRGLGQSLHLLDDAIKQVRTLTFSLYPAMLDDLGLVPTLQWYGELFGAQVGVQVTVSEIGKRQPIPSEVAGYLFRATKELLNNAVKHGRSREVLVTVHWQPGLLRLVIDDDGCGFDPIAALQPQSRHGIGLAGIRERIISLGGQMCLESEAGKGARVILELANQQKSS